MTIFILGELNELAVVLILILLNAGEFFFGYCWEIKNKALFPALRDFEKLRDFL